MTLNRFFYYVRIYFLIEAQYIKARMQYRADFMISSVAMFFTSLTTIAVFWVIFDSITQLAGWSFEQLLFIYAFYMLATSPMQVLFDHFWQLRFHVIEGVPEGQVVVGPRTVQAHLHGPNVHRLNVE